MRRLSCGGRRLCLPSTADPPKPLFPLPWLKGTGGLRLRPARPSTGQRPVASRQWPGRPSPFLLPLPIHPSTLVAPHPHPGPPPSAGEGRERGPSACGPHVLRRASGQPPGRPSPFLLPWPTDPSTLVAPHPHPGPPPNAGGVRGKSSTCRALPNIPKAPYSTASTCRRPPKEPAKVAAASVATRAGRKRTTPSPYPPPRWGEGFGCGRCAPGLLSTWAMGGGNATAVLRWSTPLPPLNCRSSETSFPSPLAERYRWPPVAARTSFDGPVARPAFAFPSPVANRPINSRRTPSASRPSPQRGGG